VRIKVNYIAPLLAAGAAAVAITAAPIAAAAPAPAAAAAHGACDAGVSGSICDTPGAVGMNNSLPPVSFDPYGGEGFLLGNYGGDFRGEPRDVLGGDGFHGGGGGFHGGGGGGHR
jgi:hypothetical protein